MAKNIKTRVLSGAGALALAIGISGGIATVANSAIEYPHMEIDVSCSDDGKTAMITATTTSMGSFGDFHPTVGDPEIRKVDRFITVNGTVVGHSEFTHYQDVETYRADLPAGDFTIDGYFIDFWWEKGDNRVENPDPKPFGYDDTPISIDESCGWVDDGEDDTPDPTYTPTDEPTEPDPGEKEPEPEPTEGLADGEGGEVGETEDSPEPVVTESEPEKTTETVAAGAKDEMPPTGASVALGILSAALIATGAVALLRVRKVLSNA